VLFTSSAGSSGTRAPVRRTTTAPAAPIARRDAPTTRAAANRLPPVPEKHNRRTIIIDAGHGGVDNGMTGPLGGGPRIYEKNVTLAVAKKLGAELEERGVDVVYTRTTDTLIALDDRGRIANRANGDLFISIHVNAANPGWKDPGGSRGFETYFLSEARTEDARRVEQMENESVQYETPSSESGTDPLSFIKADMAQNEHLRESSELADLIQQSLARMHPGPSRGVKQAGFRVLVTAYMPSVLVEIGFGTNPKEAAYISDPRKQDALAAAVADGAMTYLRRYEDRVKPSGPGGGPQR
jgi:N-acetylmuramoyl-L-alanine amidase